MENKMVIETEAAAEKVGLTAATLPWWARVLIARHTEAAFPSFAVHPVIRHCRDCSRAVVSTDPYYSHRSARCPECASKNLKNQTSQGGN